MWGLNRLSRRNQMFVCWPIAAAFIWLGTLNWWGYLLAAAFFMLPVLPGPSIGKDTPERGS